MLNAVAGQVAATLTAGDTAAAGNYQLVFTVGAVNYGPLNYAVTATPTPGTMVSQWLRLEYSFSVLPQTRTGPAAGRYSVTVSNDYLSLLRRTQVRGSVYASTALLANGFADAIQTAAVSGAASVLRDERTQDTEWIHGGRENVEARFRDRGGGQDRRIDRVA